MSQHLPAPERPSADAWSLSNGAGAPVADHDIDGLDGLARRAAAQDPGALDALLRQIDERRLDIPAIRRVLINDADVDDAHQETLIAVARSIELFRGESAFQTWLFSIARNRAVDLLRRKRDAQALPGEAATVGQRLSSMVATRADLRAAIDRLDEPYRSALVLRDVEHTSYADIAHQLDIGINTVKSRIHRARALLAGALGDGLFEEIAGDG